MMAWKLLNERVSLFLHLHGTVDISHGASRETTHGMSQFSLIERLLMEQRQICLQVPKKSRGMAEVSVFFDAWFMNQGGHREMRGTSSNRLHCRHMWRCHQMLQLHSAWTSGNGSPWIPIACHCTQVISIINTFQPLEILRRCCDTSRKAITTKRHIFLCHPWDQ